MATKMAKCLSAFVVLIMLAVTALSEQAVTGESPVPVSELTMAEDAAFATATAYANFSPPHSDYGLDTNSDVFYDYLVVEASVEVVTAGVYRVDEIGRASCRERV